MLFGHKTLRKEGSAESIRAKQKQAAKIRRIAKSKKTKRKTLPARH